MCCSDCHQGTDCRVESRCSGLLPVDWKSQDQLWAYWLLSVLVDRWPSRYCQEIANDLSRIALGHDDEAAHLVALRILAKNRMLESEAIRERLETLRKEDPEDREEYTDIESLLE